MKNKILAIILIIIPAITSGQNNVDYKTGTVSYISSQHVYVVFDNTEGINSGDTLFTKTDEKLSPAMIVKSLSSSSCMCVMIKKKEIRLYEKITSKIRTKLSAQITEIKARQQTEAIDINKEILHNRTEVKNNDNQLSGHLSVSSYSYGFRDSTLRLTQRLRYTSAITISRIAGTNLSAESYLTYTHKIVEPTTANDALKVYSLALNYDISDKFRLSAGRKINPNISNIGAIDGIQAEFTGKSLSAGIVTGFRPGYYTYGLNTNLLQYGAFVGHSYKNDNQYAKTSIALFNQTSGNVSYRRFAYLQHSNSLLKNLDFFGSAELDFYSVENGVSNNTFDLTSVYLSLRYRPFRNLSLSTSYDARKNVYFYETLKNFVDSLVDRETRQGLKFLATYRPFNKLSVTGTAGYKSANHFSSASFNTGSYVTYSQLPFIDVAANVNFSYLKTNYVDGTIYGGSLSKDFVNGNVNADLSYKYINYLFNNTSSTLKQHVLNLNLSWRISKKIYLSTDFEATLDSDGNPDGRLFLNISRRF